MKNLPAPESYPKLVYVKEEAYRVIFDKSLDCYGETDFEKKTITLKAGMSKRATFTTFIHELLHAVADEGGINITHKHIYDLETSIFELLIDNFL